MRFTVKFSEESIQDFREIPNQFRQMIQRAIECRLQTDPMCYGKPLRHSLKGFRSLRVSKYRVLYKVIEIENNVLIVKIEIRRDVYE